MPENEFSQWSAQWNEQVKLGALESMAYFRKCLRRGGTLDPETRQGLVDLLTYTEQHLCDMWDLLNPREELTHAKLCRAAGKRLKESRV